MGLGFPDKLSAFKKLVEEHCDHLAIAASAAHSRMQLLKVATPINSPLSARQREILIYLACGYKTDSIADKLNISVSAVNLYFHNLKKKLNVKTREQALAQALVNGWIDP